MNGHRFHGIRTTLILVALGSALVLFGWPASSVRASAAPDADLERVLAAFDEVQRSIHTLTAELTETTHSPLLAQPIEARGRFYMTKPDRVRWEYSEPEEMRFVIAEDRYTGYFPAQKRAEMRDIHRWRERLFRMLGLGQASAELEQAYDISLRGGSGSDGPWVLELEPKKKRFRKRMESVLLWIDRQSYLPVRVEYASKNGTTRTIRFHDVRVNPDLSASLYTMELPADVKITQGFSALSGLGDSAED